MANNTAGEPNWWYKALNMGPLTFTVTTDNTYSFGFTGWSMSRYAPGQPQEEVDEFGDWVKEVRRIAALEETIQGS